MSASVAKRVLFIGIVQDGKVVEERSIPAGDEVSLGGSSKATFQIPLAAFGGEDFTLFASSRDGYAIRFTSAVKGKITARGERVTLENVSADPKVSSEGGVFVLPLDENDKGKVRIDAVTILFKFVEQAVVAPQPPTAEKYDFRPRFIEDESDPIFLASLALWTALGAVMAVWIRNTEPTVMELEELPDRFTRLILDEAPEPEEVVVEEDALALNKTESTEKAPEAETEPADEVEKAERAEKAKEDVAGNSELFKQLQARLLATTGANSSGTVLLENAAGNTDDISGRLAEAEAAGAALGDGSRIRGGDGTVGGTGDRNVGGVGELQAGTVGAGAVGDVRATAPKGSVSAGDLDFSGGDVSEVGKVVRRYQGQLKYCYESGLKKNPALAGRVVVGWVVEGGSATDVFIVENTTSDDEFADCIKGKIRRWTFEGVPDGEAKSPFVFVPQD